MPFRLPLLIFERLRLSSSESDVYPAREAKPHDSKFSADGKAKPFRTSGGGAESRLSPPTKEFLHKAKLGF